VKRTSAFRAASPVALALEVDVHRAAGHAEHRHADREEAQVVPGERRDQTVSSVSSASVASVVQKSPAEPERLTVGPCCHLSSFAVV
jgi:hypothetical protein